MIQRFNWFQLISVGLGAAFSVATLPAQQRADLIEAARTEKEAHLTPEAPPRPERVLVRIEESKPYTLLTGEMGGFGIGFGAIVPGSGFAIGPHFKRFDLLRGQLTFTAEARLAANQSLVGSLGLSLPHLFRDRASLEFTTVHRNVSEMPYYGPGPDSRKSGRSDYRLEDTTVELRPGIHPFKGLRAGLVGSFLAVNIGPGHSSNYISTDRQFAPSVTPGIDRQTNFWRGGGFVEYDWRDRDSGATSGGRYSAQYVRYLDRDSLGYSFLRLDLDAAQYLPLFNRSRVIALHGSSSLTTTSGNERVPFYLQPTLGGPDSLRGYRMYRFYGDNSVTVNGEYRWELSPIADMVAFIDAGKVFNRWERWNLHGLESDVGFGFRLKARGRSVFHFDTGFSHEGFQIWFRANNLF